MKKFITPAIDRAQVALFRETLDESVPQDHLVRVVDWILDRYDFKEYEARYSGKGHPSYHPSDMTKLLVYAYSKGIVSSRQIEDNCRNRIDFIWLMRGMAPDHDTIANFRRENLEDFILIFDFTLSILREAGVVPMESVAVDGTRIEANCGRSGTMSRKGIEKAILKNENEIRRLLDLAEEKDLSEDKLYGKASPYNIPRKLRNARVREERLKKALEKVKEKEAREEKRRGRKKKTESRVPVTDPDSDVMRDKKGGFSPNYSVTLVVDTFDNVIVAGGVSTRHNDHESFIEAVEEAEINTGIRPGQALADVDYATDEIISWCEDRDIDPCICTKSGAGKEKRVELPEGFPRKVTNVNGEEIELEKLPANNEGRIDRKAMKWNEDLQAFICVMGYLLQRVGKKKKEDKKSGKTTYRGDMCCQCPVKVICTKSERGRTVDVWRATETRDRQEKRMEGDQHRRDYRKRKSTVEPVIGTIKQAMGIRRFSLRGDGKPNGEMNIVKAAYNARKIGKWIERLGFAGMEAMMAL